MSLFDFGVFLPIANNGMIASTAYQYMPTFALNKAIALTAEELDYSFIFSMTKWRGYGGTTQHWDHAKESFSLMSGLAAVTDRIQLVASIALPTLHPAVAARMAVTLDDIGNGAMFCQNQSKNSFLVTRCRWVTLNFLMTPHRARTRVTVY